MAPVWEDIRDEPRVPVPMRQATTHFARSCASRTASTKVKPSRKVSMIATTTRTSSSKVTAASASPIRISASLPVAMETPSPSPRATARLWR